MSTFQFHEDEELAKNNDLANLRNQGANTGAKFAPNASAFVFNEEEELSQAKGIAGLREKGRNAERYDRRARRHQSQKDAQNQNDGNKKPSAAPLVSTVFDKATPEETAEGEQLFEQGLRRYHKRIAGAMDESEALRLTSVAAATADRLAESVAQANTPVVIVPAFTAPAVTAAIIKKHQKQLEQQQQQRQVQPSADNANGSLLPSDGKRTGTVSSPSTKGEKASALDPNAAPYTPPAAGPLKVLFLEPATKVIEDSTINRFLGLGVPSIVVSDSGASDVVLGNQSGVCCSTSLVATLALKRWLSLESSAYFAAQQQRQKQQKKPDGSGGEAPQAEKKADTEESGLPAESDEVTLSAHRLVDEEKERAAAAAVELLNSPFAGFGLIVVERAHQMSLETQAFLCVVKEVMRIQHRKRRDGTLNSKHTLPKIVLCLARSQQDRVVSYFGSSKIRVAVAERMSSFSSTTSKRKNEEEFIGTTIVNCHEAAGVAATLVDSTSVTKVSTVRIVVDEERVKREREELVKRQQDAFQRLLRHHEGGSAVSPADAGKGEEVKEEDDDDDYSIVGLDVSPAATAAALRETVSRFNPRFVQNACNTVLLPLLSKLAKACFTVPPSSCPTPTPVIVLYGSVKGPFFKNFYGKLIDFQRQCAALYSAEVMWSETLDKAHTLLKMSERKTINGNNNSSSAATATKPSLHVVILASASQLASLEATANVAIVGVIDFGTSNIVKSDCDLGTSVAGTNATNQRGDATVGATSPLTATTLEEMLLAVGERNQQSAMARDGHNGVNFDSSSHINGSEHSPTSFVYSTPVSHDSCQWASQEELELRAMSVDGGLYIQLIPEEIIRPTGLLLVDTQEDKQHSNSPTGRKGNNTTASKKTQPNKAPSPSPRAAVSPDSLLPTVISSPPSVRRLLSLLRVPLKPHPSFTFTPSHFIFPPVTAAAFQRLLSLGLVTKMDERTQYPYYVPTVLGELVALLPPDALSAEMAYAVVLLASLGLPELGAAIATAAAVSLTKRPDLSRIDFAVRGATGSDILADTHYFLSELRYRAESRFTVERQAAALKQYTLPARVNYAANLYQMILNQLRELCIIETTTITEQQSSPAVTGNKPKAATTTTTTTTTTASFDFLGKSPADVLADLGRHLLLASCAIAAAFASNATIVTRTGEIKPLFFTPNGRTFTICSLDSKSLNALATTAPAVGGVPAPSDAEILNDLPPTESSSSNVSQASLVSLCSTVTGQNAAAATATTNKIVVPLSFHKASSPNGSATLVRCTVMPSGLFFAAIATLRPTLAVLHAAASSPLPSSSSPTATAVAGTAFASAAAPALASRFGGASMAVVLRLAIHGKSYFGCSVDDGNKIISARAAITRCLKILEEKRLASFESRHENAKAQRLGTMAAAIDDDTGASKILVKAARRALVGGRVQSSETKKKTAGSAAAVVITTATSDRDMEQLSAFVGRLRGLYGRDFDFTRCAKEALTAATDCLSEVRVRDVIRPDSFNPSATTSVMPPNRAAGNTFLMAPPAYKATQLSMMGRGRGGASLFPTPSPTEAASSAAASSSFEDASFISATVPAAPRSVPNTAVTDAHVPKDVNGYAAALANTSCGRFPAADIRALAAQSTVSSSASGAGGFAANNNTHHESAFSEDDVVYNKHEVGTSLSDPSALVIGGNALATSANRGVRGGGGGGVFAGVFGLGTIPPPLDVVGNAGAVPPHAFHHDHAVSIFDVFNGAFVLLDDEDDE